jgi:hypothetical protein
MGDTRQTAALQRCAAGDAVFAGFDGLTFGLRTDGGRRHHPDCRLTSRNAPLGDVTVQQLLHVVTGAGCTECSPADTIRGRARDYLHALDNRARPLLEAVDLATEGQLPAALTRQARQLMLTTAGRPSGPALPDADLTWITGLSGDLDAAVMAATTPISGGPQEDLTGRFEALLRLVSACTAAAGDFDKYWQGRDPRGVVTLDAAALLLSGSSWAGLESAGADVARKLAGRGVNSGWGVPAMQRAGSVDLETVRVAHCRSAARHGSGSQLVVMVIPENLDVAKDNVAGVAAAVALLGGHARYGAAMTVARGSRIGSGGVPVVLRLPARLAWLAQNAAVRLRRRGPVTGDRFEVLHLGADGDAGDLAGLTEVFFSLWETGNGASGALCDPRAAFDAAAGVLR